MKVTGWFSGLSNQRHSSGKVQRIAGSLGVAILLVAAGAARGQNAVAPAPDARMSVPDGYSARHSVDVGGRVAAIKGSGAMYDTLMNLQSGPRVLGETFEMRALPDTKHPLVDTLFAVGSGFGGDPNNFTGLDFAKGRIYEFSGTFRRDRQYFDYDLLGNGNIPGGQSIPIGPTAAPTGAYPWPQEVVSPVMFNTVRRMTDTSVTLFPLSMVTWRAGYSQNIFQGPSLSPSGYQFAGSYDVLLQEYQRNSSDDFTGALDWKPVRGTKLTFEEQIDHLKMDSFFTMAPGYFNVQEADGTPVALLSNYDALTPYSASACNTSSMGGLPLLSSPPSSGGLPVINAACAVISSYMRSQPTRILYPTEILRLQSASIRNVSMNGNFRYTHANMNLPDYYDSFEGLTKASGTAGANRSITYLGNASAKREVVAADYGIVWQAVPVFSLSDQIDFSSVHEPGTAVIASGTTLQTPATAGGETINYAGPLTTISAATGASSFEGSPAIGTPLPGYFGQRFITNDFSGTWDAASRITLSLTYRHVTHTIAEGTPGTSPAGAAAGTPCCASPLAVGATSDGTVAINENGGIFTAAVRPTANWDVNGSVQVLYADNAFTSVGARQTRRYRFHTIYKPKPWATLSGAFNDAERHNNTNNNQALVAEFVPPSATPAPKGTAATGTPYEGPLDHVDHSRVVSLGASLAPSEHYGFDLYYAHSDVYMATNICYNNGATATIPGAVAGPNATTCPNVFGRGATAATELAGTALSDWYARDFMDAPTQFASAAIHLSPVDKVHANIGYRVSDVGGSQFFTDARSVNGSLDSRYQSPFFDLAWTIHSGLIWKAEYNYYGYGEAGPSGSQYCSAATTATATVVPCASLSYPTGVTEPTSGLTAPRVFHANNVTLSMHYEF